MPPQAANGIVDTKIEKLTNKKVQETSFLSTLLKENEKYVKTRKTVKKIHTPQGSVISQLYRYASIKDIILMVIGLIAAVSNGVMLPMLSLFFGGLASVFVSQEKYEHDTRYKSNLTIDLSNFAPFSDPLTSTVIEENGLPSDFITEVYFFDIISKYTMYFIYIGILMFTSAFIQVSCWETACANQICKLRQIYFAQTLRQDLGWYDDSEDGDLSIKITDDMERMRDGLGSKVPLLSQALTTLIAGMVVGFLTSWKLSLIILAGGPVILIASAVSAKISQESAIREQLRYGIAGGIASEIMTSIRTVAAFGMQKDEIDRFDVALIEGRRVTIKRYYYLSCAMGVSIGFMYLMYGIGILYGSDLYLNGYITPGQIFTVFMSIITGAFGIGNALPLLSEVGNAIGAASNVFGIIDSVPTIDPYSTEGLVLDKFEGKIEFNNVYFSYPSRSEVMVLSGLDLVIQPGQIVALVGPSGSGKSTVINLLLRFYDPLCGKVLIDNVNIKEMNVESLRRNIGVVSQEPVLFDVTVEENIRYGNSEATEEDIRTAAKLANAHKFIENMPKGYQTMVGERGVQLSGGQKQRIAIARALVSNPKVLLLDEATSALDAQSEAIVQGALENAMRGRTTIIIAHRLSTVRNADVIYAMKKGRLIESGTHEELMQLKGIYYNLVLTQNKDNVADEKKPKEEIEKPIKRYSIKRKSSRRKSAGSKSALSLELQKDIVEEIEVDEININYLDLLKLNTDKFMIGAAIISCIIGGFHIPSFAVLYGGVLNIFMLSNDEFHNAVVFSFGMFCLLAVVTMISLIVAVLTTSIGTENMIKELRLTIFKNILSQEISLFDEEDYTPTKLINLLARDPPLIKCIAGMRAGHIIISATTLLLSLVIAFYCGWQLALIVVAFLPLLIYGNWKQGKMRFSSFIKESAATEQATKLASECLQNIKTVQSLCLQEHMVNVFTNKLFIAHKDEKKHGYVFAFTYAFSTSIVFFMYACTYRFGAVFISEDIINAANMYRSAFAIAFAATTIGASTVFFLDFSKGKVSVSNAVHLMHIKSTLDPFSNEGTKPEIKGGIEFKDIWFSYPTRRHQTILRGLDLIIEPGQTVALVGGSGCGKSTIITLLERFYFPQKGKVLLDGVEIANINVAHLRNNLGLVTQEPTLFDTTIRENIVYGAKSLGRTISDQQVIQAAKEANIHEFITSLPQGYETKVGDRGSKLSGGQKQRIAIARALIRNPKILLLDEATSALDTESEKIVQVALDKAREGRTCIIIAHRLSTIQNADKIVVIHNGTVAEQGTHEELKALGGHYYELIKNQ